MIGSNKVIGIDFSISCPSVCVYDVKSKQYTIQAWTHSKQAKVEPVRINESFIIGCEYNKMNDDYYFVLADKIMEFIRSQAKPIDKIPIYVENYAFSSSGQITRIAECLGSIKYLWYKYSGLTFFPVGIPQGKMMGNEGMKGNVGKYTNIEYFIRTYCPELLTKTGLDIIQENPLSDWVDSFNICKFGIYVEQYKAGDKKNIPDKILTSIKKSV